MKFVETTVYATATAKRMSWSAPDPDTGLRSISGMRISKITQSYPETRDADSVVVKLKIKLPASAFNPLVPEATIEVPESMIDKPVLVSVEEMDDDRDS